MILHVVGVKKEENPTSDAHSTSCKADLNPD